VWGWYLTPQATVGTSSAISNGAVRLLREYTGRGPTKARTTINHDSVMILFGDTLTKGEKKLADIGDGDVVLHMRHRYGGRGVRARAFR
jgi:uncharacterized protein YbcI